MKVSTVVMAALQASLVFDLAGPLRAQNSETLAVDQRAHSMEAPKTSVEVSRTLG